MTGLIANLIDFITAVLVVLAIGVTVFGLALMVNLAVETIKHRENQLATFDIFLTIVIIWVLLLAAYYLIDGNAYYSASK